MTPLFENYKNHIKINNSGHEYIRFVFHFLNFCEKNNIDFVKIGKLDLDKFLLTLRERNLQDNSMNVNFKAIRHFYRFLLESNLVTEEGLKPIYNLKLIKVEQKEPKYITKEELDEIIEMGASFCGMIDPIKLKIVMYFLYYTGLRKGEFLKLKREDFDLENFKVLIRIPTKGKKERKAIYPKVFGPQLQDYFKSDPEQINAFNITENQFDYLFHCLKEFAPKGKPFHPHILRHSFANMIMKKIKDIRILQKLLGHSDIKTTMIYYNPNEEDITEAYHKNIKDISRKEKRRR